MVIMSCCGSLAECFIGFLPPQTSLRSSQSCHTLLSVPDTPVLSGNIWNQELAVLSNHMLVLGQFISWKVDSFFSWSGHSPMFCDTWRFINVFITAYRWTLSQASQIWSKSAFMKFHFNIILCLHVRLPSSLSSRIFWLRPCMHISIPLHAPSHSFICWP